MHTPSLVKLHWYFLKVLSENENTDGRAYDSGQMFVFCVQTYSETDTNDQHETIIPHPYCVAGCKKCLYFEKIHFKKFSFLQSK